MQMAEKHTPLGQIKAVFLSPARSHFLYITQKLRISDNPYICKKKDHERLQHAVQERGHRQNVG
jgi:hypothetical protein